MWYTKSPPASWNAHCSICIVCVSLTADVVYNPGKSTSQFQMSSCPQLSCEPQPTACLLFSNCRGEVVPLNPEEWTAADDGDGLSAEELDACIDLLEEDEEDEQQQQRQQDQQQQRSGGRRRRPLYDAAAGGGSDQDQAQVGSKEANRNMVFIVHSNKEQQGLLLAGLPCGERAHLALSAICCGKVCCLILAEMLV